VSASRARANALLTLAALIWGSAFVAQSIAARSLPPLTFTGLRFLLGAAIVAPLAWREWRMLGASGRRPRRRDLGYVGLLGGLVFLGAALQQVALRSASVTHTGFLTALYIPQVPLLAWLALGQRPHWTIGPAVAGCLAGTWMLTTAAGAGAALQAGDAWAIASSVPWAVHVLLVGHAANRLSGPLVVACGQFAACGVLALAAGLAFEAPAAAGVTRALGPIAYTGAVSVALGYTLQVVAQRRAHAADSAIVLSSETVFAAAFGALFLGERLDGRGLAGCALILACVLMVQLQPLARSWLKRPPTAPGRP
jgi:drug/metabolite transporter (DMT)-like permease